MTKSEVKEFKEAIALSITDVESASRIEDLAVRMESAIEQLESIFNECVSVFDEMENAINAVEEEPISITMGSKPQSILDYANATKEILKDGLSQGARKLESEGIHWYFSGERIEAFIDGNWIPAWYVQTEEDTAEICLEYFGSPRTFVPVSNIRRPQEA